MFVHGKTLAICMLCYNSVLHTFLDDFASSSVKSNFVFGSGT